MNTKKVYVVGYESTSINSVSGYDYYYDLKAAKNKYNEHIKNGGDYIIYGVLMAVSVDLNKLEIDEVVESMIRDNDYEHGANFEF